jgi:hypothetical protein
VVTVCSGSRAKLNVNETEIRELQEAVLRAKCKK